MDMVDNPAHYQSDTGLEAIEVIRAFFKDNYNLGQVFKYIARCDRKWNDLEDLKKARKYLDWEIEWRTDASRPGEHPGERYIKVHSGNNDVWIDDRVQIGEDNPRYGIVYKASFKPNGPLNYTLLMDDGSFETVEVEEMWKRDD